MRSAHNILNFDIGVEYRNGNGDRTSGRRRRCSCLLLLSQSFSSLFSVCFEHKRTAVAVAAAVVVAVVVLSERALTTHRATFQLVCNLMRSNPVFYFN